MDQFLYLYGGPAIGAFFVTLFFISLTLFLLKRAQFSGRVFRFGGVPLILGFFFVLLLSPVEVYPFTWIVFLGALLFALIIGSYDDWKNLSWRAQLVAQVFLLSLLYFGGVRILQLTLPGGFEMVAMSLVHSWGYLLFLVWGLVILNAMNWLDGIDGLSGGVMTVFLGTLFVFSLSPVVNQPPLAILLAVAFGATGAFLVYNFPPARIIVGTSGTLFFGLITVFVSVVAGTKIATILLVLAIPLIDCGFVVLKRILKKQSPFKGDKEHLHYILQKRGWSARYIIAAYTLTTFLIALLALFTEQLGKFTAIILVFLCLGGIAGYFHFFEKKIRIFFLGIALLTFIIGIILLTTGNVEKKNIYIHGNWFLVEVADTESERVQGLSGRESICARCGMMFLFPEAAVTQFWMKDMKFSLDFLWIRDGKVIAKNENVPYPSLLPFGPEELVDTVIELPAGAAKDIEIGDKVYFWE